MGEDEAVSAFARYLGRPEAGFAPRKIAMKIGFRQEVWSHNCVALGLAQGFVEPLEATSILLTDFAAHLLSRNFPRQRGDEPALRRHVNEATRTAWERVIDFIQLHYHLSDRSDSAFWLDNRQSSHLSETLRDRLAKWRVVPPQATDFGSRFELFSVENYLYVLYGMKFPTRGFPVDAAERREAQQRLAEVDARARRLVQELPSHREWLEGLRAAAQAAR